MTGGFESTTLNSTCVTTIEPAGHMITSSTWPRAIAQTLGQLWEQQLLCDIVIETSDQLTIPAHKCVLAAASKYFLANLKSKISEGDAKERSHSLKLSQFSLDIVYTILRYIYFGEVFVLSSDLSSVQKAAEILEMPELANLCAASQSASGASYQNESATGEQECESLSIADDLMNQDLDHPVVKIETCIDPFISMGTSVIDCGGSQVNQLLGSDSSCWTKEKSCDG